MKKIFTIIAFILLINTVNAVNVNVTDTIAGYSTLLKSSKTLSNTDMIFKVVKPNWSDIKIQSRTDSNWYAEVEFDWFHTKQAWVYKVYSALNNEIFKNPNEFKVFADVFSPVKSSLSSDKASLSAKNDTLIVNVNIKDKHGNNIPNQLIKLLSSRNQDKISSNNNITNEKWQVSFSVKSSQAWISIFTAMNQSINQEINKRQKIVFYKPEEKKAFWWSLFSASLLEEDWYTDEVGAEFWVLDSFAITISPEEVVVNSDQNYLTIIAQDADGNTVKNYVWTIIIETNDANAIIPNSWEYTFTEQDQGKKKFDLAIIFSQIGEVQLHVFDIDDE